MPHFIKLEDTFIGMTEKEYNLYNAKSKLTQIINDATESLMRVESQIIALDFQKLSDNHITGLCPTHNLELEESEMVEDRLDPISGHVQDIHYVLECPECDYTENLE